MEFLAHARVLAAFVDAFGVATVDMVLMVMLGSVVAVPSTPTDDGGGDEERRMCDV